VQKLGDHQLKINTFSRYSHKATQLTVKHRIFILIYQHQYIAYVDNLTVNVIIHCQNSKLNSGEVKW